jgi:formylglycine-generating enzyme required for sulfatase activity
LVDQMVKVTTPSGDVWVGQYEASRPDATSTDAGIIDNQRACQFPNRMPWTFVNQEAAKNACELIKNSAGQKMRLCTEAEWQEACEDEVVAPNASWSFSTSPTTYAQNTCNDKRFCTSNAECLSGTCTDGFCTCNSNAQCLSREVCSSTTNGYCTGKPWASGSVAACHTEYASGSGTTNDIFDLSGNVAEWTSSGVSTDSDPLTFEYYRVRGGGYSSFGPATACNFSFVLEKPSFANADVGFRCCSNAAP